MRIDSNQHYFLRNSMVGHVAKFFPGTETEPACFTGAIIGTGPATWRPDGTYVDKIDSEFATHDAYDIVRRASPDEVQVYRVLVGQYTREDTPPDANLPLPS